MILIIIKSYFAILIAIGLGAIFALVLGLYFAFRAFKKQKNLISHNKRHATEHQDIKKSFVLSSNDIHAISGEDVMATQLDLARAYIETGRKRLAKKILNHVVDQGSGSQQSEAKYLLLLCE